jgi:hypothetical protein
MKAECQAMMAKKQEMQDKLQAIDATLDKLVAEMNAAKSSKEVDAQGRGEEAHDVKSPRDGGAPRVEPPWFYRRHALL